MTSMEETGRDVEEATQTALKKLGVTEDEVDVEILEEGARGFLGLGQSPARVRVTIKTAPAAEVKPKREAAPRPRRKPKPRPKAEAKPAPEKPKKQAEPAPPAAEVPETPVVEAAPVASADTVKQAADISREALQRVLDGIGVGGKVEVRSASDGQVILDMVGGDSAILIGKHGQMIDALQYLVGIITNRRLPEKVRVIIDAEGYRGRREEALRSQALFLAKKVKETSQEAVLEALRANERRIIHTTLADDPEVYTYSEGEEPDRHVVISPRK